MHKLLVGSASLLVTVGVALPASAQTDTSAGLQLEEVVVTATKRETNLQKVSIAMEVYSAETLKKEGKKRIDEIMSGVAGVQVADTQQGATFYLRGINASPQNNETGGANPSVSTVAIMIDGVVQGRSEAVRGGTLDMAQAEVLRGPQSTTIGANSLVGAVAIVSNQPVFEYQTTASAEVGNYNLQAFQGTINAPLTSNQAVRFAFSTNKRDGYVSSGAGDSDLTNSRLKYRWQATDDLNIVVTAEHQVIGGNGVTQGTDTYQGYWEAYNPANAALYDQVSGYPYAYGHLNPATSPTIYYDRPNPWNDGFPKKGWGNGPYFTTKIDTYSTNIDWKLGFGTLTFLPSYQKISNDNIEANAAVTGAYLHLVQDQSFKQLDLRLASNSGQKLEWLTGLYYSDNSRNSTTTAIFVPGAPAMGGVIGSGGTCPSVGTTNPSNLNCYQWSHTPLASAKESSIYGNLTYSIIDSLRLSGAVRYTKDEKEFQSSKQTTAGFGGTTGTGTGGVGAISGPSVPYLYGNYTGMDAGYNQNTGGRGKGSWDKVTYRGAVEYDVLPDAMVYATYATGYQAGDVQVAMGGTNIGLFPYQCDYSDNANCALPLELQQITLGFKSRWFDNKLQANIEVFDTKYTNQPLTATAFVSNTGANAINTTQTGACTFANTGDLWGTAGGPPATLFCISDLSSTTQVKSRGIDVDMSFLPTANDRIDLTAEWLTAEYGAIKVNPPTSAQLSAFQVAGANLPATAVANLLQRINAIAAANDGLRQQNAPAQSFNTSYSHTFQMNSAGSLTPKVNWVHKATYWSAGPTTGTQSVFNTQGKYNLYNAYLNWDSADGKFSISSYMKNITSEPVLITASGRPGTANAISLDAPRTYGVVFSANF